MRRGGWGSLLRPWSAIDRAHQFEVDDYDVIGWQRRRNTRATVDAVGPLVDFGDGVDHDQPADLAVEHRPPVVGAILLCGKLIEPNVLTRSVLRSRARVLRHHRLPER
jgi:hypothetical protein